MAVASSCCTADTKRRIAQTLSSLLLLLVAFVPIRSASAFQQTTSIAITGDRLSGFVLPIEPIKSDIRLRSTRAWGWTVDDTKRLLMEGDVAISLGTYSFSSKNAVVWINRIPSDAGVINQIAIYFEEVDDPTKLAGLGAQGRKLLVTGSTRGDVRLNVTLMSDSAPARTGLLRQAEARLALYLKSLLAEPPALASRPSVNPIAAPPEFIPVPGGVVPEPAPRLPGTVDLPPVEATGAWLMNPQGSVRFSANHLDISRTEEENIFTASGDIVVEILADRTVDPTDRLTLSAERAVIFADPGPLVGADQQINSENVRGVYLEGNVSASSHNGEYFVRAPQVYYDFRTQKAIMVDSLLRVQNRDIQVPVYARAKEMRQVAANQWETKQSTVSTSDFATPHLAIGAHRAVITQRQSEDDPKHTITHLDSTDNTVRVSGVPIFYWPYFSGDAEKIPLKSIEGGTRKDDGVRLLTTWDLFALTGLEAPKGVEADLKIDGFSKRGAGGGVDLKYNVGDSEGRVDLYGLYDTGTDRTSTGQRVNPDNDFRGAALFEDQTQLTRYWSLQAQAAIISDETFISSWREEDFSNRREYESALYLKYQRDNVAFTALAKDSLQHFISNSYLLASTQYSVNKMPEFTYRRYGDSLFEDALTYSSETRLSRMSMVFVERTPTQLGVLGRAFGVGPTTLLSSAQLARGMRENWVNRADTRHEIALPLHPGIFNITPFVVGRATGYDQEFTTFSTDTNQIRLFGAAGVRINTEFQRVVNGVESQLFDLHRMRHIIEPYMTLWTSYNSVTQANLPVYDEEVESLADGQAVEIGVRNTLQTQRGGPGHWRSVDWLTLDTSVVIDSEGAPNESPTAQFFDYRPEYSMFGDHARARGTLMLSDNLSFSGDATYLFDSSLLSRSSVGVEVRHSPNLITYVEYRYIQPNALELLDVGWHYQITPKYRVTLTPQWDFRADDFRAVTVSVTRRFPDFELVFLVRYDKIRNDTLIGASLDLARF